jgi:hypothetical protein
VATIVASAFTGITASAAENVWTLKTDDTHLVLAVRENKLFIDELKNPAQGWNWTPAPSADAGRMAVIRVLIEADAREGRRS